MPALPEDPMLLFVDQLTNADFSYLHPERGLLGETWLASIQLEGKLDNQSMVCDFGKVKKQVREFLDVRVDHCLLVPTRAPNLTWTEQDDQIKLQWRFAETQLRLRSPKQAVCMIDAESITPESVAHWCEQALAQAFGEGVAKLTMSFEAEPINGAFYHYSHGLKKHGGNCQRIAHGHRSRLHIWRNGTPAPELEQAWANGWQDIYLGSREDIIGEPAGLVDFRYQAAQGDFFLSMPSRCCYLLDSDTTVECLAQHIALTLAQQNPGDTIRVQAFEGINKGAIAESQQ